MYHHIQALVPAVPPLRPLPVADAVRLSPQLLEAVYLAREEVQRLARLQHCLLQCGLPLRHDLLAGVLVVVERSEGRLALRRVAHVVPGGTEELELEGEGPVGITQLSALGPPNEDARTEGLGPHAEALVQEACWQWCHHALPIHASRRQVATMHLRLNNSLLLAAAEVDADLARWLGYASADALAADVGTRTTAEVLQVLLSSQQQQQQQPRQLAQCQENAATLAARLAADLEWQPEEAEVEEAVAALEADGAPGGEWCALQAALWQQQSPALAPGMLEPAAAHESIAAANPIPAANPIAAANPPSSPAAHAKPASAAGQPATPAAAEPAGAPQPIAAANGVPCQRQHSCRHDRSPSPQALSHSPSPQALSRSPSPQALGRSHDRSPSPQALSHSRSHTPTLQAPSSNPCNLRLSPTGNSHSHISVSPPPALHLLHAQPRTITQCLPCLQQPSRHGRQPPTAGLDPAAGRGTAAGNRPSSRPPAPAGPASTCPSRLPAPAAPASTCPSRPPADDCPASTRPNHSHAHLPPIPLQRDRSSDSGLSSAPHHSHPIPHDHSTRSHPERESSRSPRRPHSQHPTQDVTHSKKARHKQPHKDSRSRRSLSPRSSKRHRSRSPRSSKRHRSRKRSGSRGCDPLPDKGRRSASPRGQESSRSRSRSRSQRLGRRSSPAPIQAAPADAPDLSVEAWLLHALERYGGAYCRLSELLADMLRQYVYRGGTEADETRTQRLPDVMLPLVLKAGISRSSVVPRFRHSAVDRVALSLERAMPEVRVEIFGATRDIWICSAKEAALEQKDAHCMTDAQKVVRLVAPGSLLPLSTLRALYRLRYGRNLGRDEADAAQRRLPGMQPEVFVTQDGDVLVLPTASMLAKWEHTTPCEQPRIDPDTRVLLGCTSGWSCVYTHLQVEAVQEFRKWFRFFSDVEVNRWYLPLR